MLHHAHIIHIDIRLAGLRQQNRVLPKAEVIHAVRALSNGEEGFAVRAFHARHQQKLSLVQNCSGVEDRVDTHALQQEGIGFPVEAIAPGNGRVRRSQNWILVTIEDAITAGQHAVAAGEQFLLLLEELLNALLE